MKDDEIDYSDIPETDARFWEGAELVLPANKERVTIRLDRDVVDWFKDHGKGYQTRINAVLRAFVNGRRGSER
ncbi:MAG TPA: 3-oxoacyl-ACP synthase [Rhodospirillales bacterium]|nr:3-oxoacyl-ACP synthase [Rhodospirillales bacterium]